MLTKQVKSTQEGLYRAKLEYSIDLKHPIILLSEKINWKIFENEFEKYYSKYYGRAAKPIRLMVSLLILKSLLIK